MIPIYGTQHFFLTVGTDGVDVGFSATNGYGSVTNNSFKGATITDLRDNSLGNNWLFSLNNLPVDPGAGFWRYIRTSGVTGIAFVFASSADYTYSAALDSGTWSAASGKWGFLSHVAPYMVEMAG